MAGMLSDGSGSSQPGWLLIALRFGPEILIASLVPMTIGVGSRRRRALIPVAVGGAILYVGMYGQSNLPTMYAAIVIGTALLLTGSVGSFGLRPRMARPAEHG